MVGRRFSTMRAASPSGEGFRRHRRVRHRWRRPLQSTAKAPRVQVIPLNEDAGNGSATPACTSQLQNCQLNAGGRRESRPCRINASHAIALRLVNDPLARSSERLPHPAESAERSRPKTSWCRQGNHACNIRFARNPDRTAGIAISIREPVRCPFHTHTLWWKVARTIANSLSAIDSGGARLACKMYDHVFADILA